MVILLILLFLVCQVYLEKRGLPKKIANWKFRYILISTLALIAAAIVVGTLLHVAVPMTATASVLGGSVIAYKFRQKYENLVI